MLHLQCQAPVGCMHSAVVRPGRSQRLCCLASQGQQQPREACKSSRQPRRLVQAVSKCGAAFLLAGGLLIAVPDLTPPAQAESAADTRRAAMEQRRELLAKARENALKKASEITPSPTEGASEPAKESSGLGDSKSFSFSDDLQKQQAESASKMETKDLAPSTAAPVDEPRAPSPKAAAPKSEGAKKPEPLKAEKQPEKQPEPVKKEEPKPAPAFGASKQPLESAKEAAKEAAKSIPKPEPEKLKPALPTPTTPSFNLESKPKVQGDFAPLKPKSSVQGEMPKSMTSMKADLKKDTSKGKKQKRKGPLPMTLAQLLILAFYGGLGYAVAIKDAEVRSALRAASGFISSGYNKAVDSLPKQLKQKT